MRKWIQGTERSSKVLFLSLGLLVTLVTANVALCSTTTVRTTKLDLLPAARGPAGTMTSGGGVGVSCSNQETLQLYDFWEGNRLGQFSIDSLQPQRGMEDAITESAAIIEKLQIIDLGMHQRLKQELQVFSDSHLLLADARLPFTNDSRERMLPLENCQVVQIAVRREVRLASEPKYWIDKNHFERLPRSHQVGLVLHEVIYGVFAERFEHANSVGSRFYNRLLIQLSQVLGDRHLQGPLYFEDQAEMRILYNYVNNANDAFNGTAPSRIRNRIDNDIELYFREGILLEHSSYTFDKIYQRIDAPLRLSQHGQNTEAIIKIQQIDSGSRIHYQLRIELNQNALLKHFLNRGYNFGEGVVAQAYLNIVKNISGGQNRRASDFQEMGDRQIVVMLPWMRTYQDQTGNLGNEYFYRPGQRETPADIQPYENFLRLQTRRLMESLGYSSSLNLVIFPFPGGARLLIRGVSATEKSAKQIEVRSLGHKLNGFTANEFSSFFTGGRNTITLDLERTEVIINAKILDRSTIPMGNHQNLVIRGNRPEWFRALTGGGEVEADVQLIYDNAGRVREHRVVPGFNTIFEVVPAR